MAESESHRRPVRRDTDDDWSGYGLRHENLKRSSGDWVRWVVLCILGLSVPSFGFVVQLSNRMTAMEITQHNAEQQRAELIQVFTQFGTRLDKFSDRVDSLNNTVIILNQWLEQTRQTDPAVRRGPTFSDHSRMFDK